MSPRRAAKPVRRPCRLPKPLLLCLAVFGLLGHPAAAWAHGGEASIVLLLPTGYYILASAAAVAATFLLMSLLPAQAIVRLFRHSWCLPAFPCPPAALASLASSVFLALMVLAGFVGSRDPLLNPLPATIWTGWWVGFTLIQGLVGPLWPALNPWRGVLALLCAATGRYAGRTAPFALPARLGYGIAILQFSAFAWFELVDIAPSDPTRLATAVSAYWLFNLAGMLLFGEQEWNRRAEPFSIFFGLIGRAAPLRFRRRDDGGLQPEISWPGKHLFDLESLPPSGVCFVLLTLSTVSFDGLSRTFAWLAAIGVNPLEFEGRSTVMLSSTLGIVLCFAVLALGYFGAIGLGCLATGERRFGEISGRLIFSIVPISLAFQFAHYLTMLLVEGQNLLIGLSDPYARGWDLLGTAGDHVTTSFLNRIDTVETIFDTQAAAIVVGHVLAVILAHALSRDFHGRGRAGLIGELPFAALMVAYTAFGLWLLSTPRI